jgi:hypothetical protein
MLVASSSRLGLAEGVGFEPTIRLPVYTLSKRAPSATRPSLRSRSDPHYSQATSTDNPPLRRAVGGATACVAHALTRCYRRRGENIATNTPGGKRMIVRDGADGSLILIAQTDHAKLSGQCAAHWGHQHFARPRPYDAVVRAAMFHDSGWYDYEASPSIAADTGRPLNFLQVVWGEPQRRAFEWAIDWMTRIDPYSGLLLSKHRTGLQRGRYGKVAHPTSFNTQNLPEDNEDFLARNEANQAAQLKNYDEAEFWTNYQLMQTFDFISLFLCNKDVVDDYIEPVPTSYDGSSKPASLALKTVEGTTIEVDPFPFDANPLRVQLLRRRLDRHTFPNAASFREAYFKATPEAVDFTLCARSH